MAMGRCQVIQTSLRGGVLIDCAKGLGTLNEMISKFLEEQLSMKPIVVIDCDDFDSPVALQTANPSFQCKFMLP